MDCFPFPFSAPWLVFPHEGSQTLLSISRGKYSVKNIPEIYGDENTLWQSSHGWLVIELWYEDLLLFLDPISMKKMKLPSPPLETYDGFFFFALPLPPTDPNCVVFFCSKDSPFFLFFRLSDIRGRNWRNRKIKWSKHKYDVEGCLIKSIVSCKGNLFAFTTGHKIAGIRVLPCPKVTLLEVEPVVGHVPLEQGIDSYVLESRGVVFLVFKQCYFNTLTFHSLMIFKMDFSRMEWVKVESIGGDCIFLLGLDGDCASYTLPKGVKGDMIYFFNYDEKAFHAFDLEDGSISINRCDNKVGNTLSGCPFWLIQPIYCQYVSRDKENANNKETKHTTITRKEVVKMDVNERNWSELEDGIIDLIRSHLFLSRDHIHFSDVCKRWRSSNPLVHLSRRPLLLFTHKRDGLCKFFDPSSNEIYDYFISLLKDTTFHFSKEGWLLLARPHPDFSFFLFNPFTNEKIDLPDFINIDDFYTSYKPLGFSFCSRPMSPDFIAFCIHSFYDYYIHIYIYRHGDKTWTKKEYKNQFPFQVGHTNPVYHDGLFYCLALDGKLGVFDPSNSAWTVLDMQAVKSEISENFIGENYMVESNGDLLSVFTDDINGSIHVFRLDRCQMQWVAAKDLRNRTLFVSHGRSLSVAATTKRGMENKIYFPTFHPDFTGSCLFHSMETESYTLDFHKANKKYVDSIWIYSPSD